MLLASSVTYKLAHHTHFGLMPTLLGGVSPALFALQQTPVIGDLSLQFHLGIQELVVALTLGGQAHPHLLQLSLQAADHLGEVLQSAGVQLLCVLQGGLQAFLLDSESHTTMSMTQRVETNATVCKVMDAALLPS